MEYDAGGEDITDSLTFERHVLDVDDFGGDKSWGATANKEIFFLISMGSKSKIADGNFKGIFFSKHDILRFKISMNDSSGRQMTDAVQ